MVLSVHCEGLVQTTHSKNKLTFVLPVYKDNCMSVRKLFRKNSTGHRIILQVKYFKTELLEKYIVISKILKECKHCQLGIQTCIHSSPDYVMRKSFVTYSILAFYWQNHYLRSDNNWFISSPEHKVLMVSYCGQSMSVVRRAASTIALKAYSSYTPGPIDLILYRKHRGDL